MLRFCFGASGAGKSTGLYQEVIKRSIEEPGTDFLIIVPDQFTMQTQKDVVRMHPSHAIMNIDVLSFGRLSHRVFEETGRGSFSVLDDVGKSLVLRHVSDLLGDKLPVIGRNMHKPGYIDEVKSTISEFMQYGIGDEDLAVLEEKSSHKGALNGKIKDLRLLYREFLSYISGNFITTEETLDILCKALPESDIIRDSVVVFDGFTGFTPIQYRVLSQLLSLAREVVVSLTISPDEDPYSPEFTEQELFMLSKKTVRDLEKLEYNLQKQQGIPVPDFDTFRQIRHQESAKGGPLGDIFIRETPSRRLKDNKPLAFLESTLFRYGAKVYSGENDSVFMYESSSPLEEIRQTMIKISELTRKEGYAYRDIALVCGSLDAYGDIVARESECFGIPVYIDQNTGVMLNPFIEYITSAINIVLSGYKYEDIFHYMRSGLTGFDRNDADILENYVRALGIKGKKRWEDKFLTRMPRRYKSRKKDDANNESEIRLLDKLESMRAELERELKPLFAVREGTVKEMTAALKQVIEDNSSESKLSAYRDMFEQAGDIRKSREYDQIYGKIMDLLEQMNALVGDEKLELEEFRDILAVGFGDISVGTIPQDVDRIMVGDIERTRLREVRVLFLVGVNDGNIPSNVGGGGILSDIDRQFLLDLGTDIEFAPTPRQQMYIQRLYLYMNLTKPTDKLYLSYSEVGNDGKSMHPAYLIPKISGMFGGLEIDRPEDKPWIDQITGTEGGLETFSGLVRQYAAGKLPSEEQKQFTALYSALLDSAKEKPAKGNMLEKLTAAAFEHYKSAPLAKAIATTLYGVNLENSVTRLEKYAGCAYAHFVKYGLHLDERAEYEFNYADLGNIYHQVLEHYTGTIMAKKLDLRTISREQSEELLDKAMEACADSYGDTILQSSFRNRYMTERIRKILLRTVETLQYQLTKGVFEPAHLEMDFSVAGNIDEINITLREDEKHNILERMRLKGSIDRVDLYEDADHVYVKIIDFKSSPHKFSVASVYYGLSLQLVLYMNVAAAVEKKLSGGKEVVPAALLYYHVNDPLVDNPESEITSDINDAIKSQLRMTGTVNENRDILNMLDNSIDPKSDVIPVTLKKNGEPNQYSQVFSEEDYAELSTFVNRKIRQFGRNILDGDIEINPYKIGQTGSCNYCPYRSICRYDERIPGFKKRDIKLSDDTAKELIKAENEQVSNNN
jgi:ATP-dependent helicase/nuclease subunit B